MVKSLDAVENKGANVYLNSNRAEVFDAKSHCEIFSVALRVTAKLMTCHIDMSEQACFETEHRFTEVIYFMLLKFTVTVWFRLVRVLNFDVQNKILI